MIRKIIIGVNPLKAMAYYIGQRAGESIVDTIILDDKHLHKYGTQRYLIYIKHPEDGVMLWKSVEGMPVLLEYDCDFS
jgi:hypothetical protein